jgi:hypothetical protein
MAILRGLLTHMCTNVYTHTHTHTHTQLRELLLHSWLKGLCLSTVVFPCLILSSGLISKHTNSFMFQFLPDEW